MTEEMRSNARGLNASPLAGFAVRCSAGYALSRRAAAPRVQRPAQPFHPGRWVPPPARPVPRKTHLRRDLRLLHTAWAAPCMHIPYADASSLPPVQCRGAADAPMATSRRPGDDSSPAPAARAAPPPARRSSPGTAPGRRRGAWCPAPARAAWRRGAGGGWRARSLRGPHPGHARRPAVPVRRIRHPRGDAVAVPRYRRTDASSYSDSLPDLPRMRF